MSSSFTLTGAEVVDGPASPMSSSFILFPGLPLPLTHAAVERRGQHWQV
jgi:hypothetical protein